MSLAHRHNADDMFETVPVPAITSAQQYFRTDSKRKKITSVRQTIDTGLDEAPQVVVTSTSADQQSLLAPLQRAVDRFKALRALEAGWDSYSALALDRQTIRPALELVLYSIHHCAEPQINATSEGGIDLVWETASRVLEIGVDGTGHFDCLFVVDGDEEEIDGTIEDATKLLERFCQQ